MSNHIDKPTQILLALPTQMVSELDSISKSRQVSRSSLIRRFLRHQIDDELKSLETYLNEAKRNKRTHVLLQERLKESDW
jgi:metal-responsive CopG/Arc/MetJ family transcriptional regulator